MSSNTKEPPGLSRQPKFETVKWESYRPSTLPWYPFDTNFKGKGNNGPPFTIISLWNAKRCQSSCGLMDHCMGTSIRYFSILSWVPFAVFYHIPVFPSSCGSSQMRYKPLKWARNPGSHLVVSLQPKFETMKWEPYRAPTLSWYLFQAHFKDKGDNDPPFNPISLWNAKICQISGEPMQPFRGNRRLLCLLWVPFDVLD
jgi:hypothetical protein